MLFEEEKKRVVKNMCVASISSFIQTSRNHEEEDLNESSQALRFLCPERQFVIPIDKLT
jgi:hypothetical protein